MAYWIVKAGNGNISSLRYYHCDHVNDIEKLPTNKSCGAEQENDSAASQPCAYGSQCLCLEDSSIWILGKESKKWIQQKAGTSSGISYFDVEPEILSEGMTWISDE